jgi:hypothetical protein
VIAELPAGVGELAQAAQTSDDERVMLRTAARRAVRVRRCRQGTSRTEDAWWREIGRPVR